MSRSRVSCRQKVGPGNGPADYPFASMSNYSLVINAVDRTEPGHQDQIRFRLFEGDPVFGDPGTPSLLYDTNWEFATGPETRARTYIDSGNLQSMMEPRTP